LNLVNFTAQGTNMQTTHIKTTCVGCQCTNKDAEVQIFRVPGFVMDNNQPFYGICYDCIAILFAFVDTISEENPEAWKPKVLVAHGKPILEKQIADKLNLFGNLRNPISDTNFNAKLRQ